MTEPYTDLPALGLVAIGLLLFVYVVISAYSSCEAKAFYADRKDDLRTIAMALAADPSITCDGMSGVLEAGRLDSLTARADILQAYGNPGDQVMAVITGDIFAWSAGSPDGDRGSGATSYRLPVTVRLNDARTIAGTLTVTATGT